MLLTQPIEVQLPHKAAVVLGKTAAVASLVLLGLLLAFLASNIWELAQTAFPLSYVISGEFPLEYNTVQGSIFNMIQAAIMFGFPFIILTQVVALFFLRSRG